MEAWWLYSRRLEIAEIHGKERPRQHGEKEDFPTVCGGEADFASNYTGFLYLATAFDSGALLFPNQAEGTASIQTDCFPQGYGFSSTFSPAPSLCPIGWENIIIRILFIKLRKTIYMKILLFILK